MMLSRRGIVTTALCLAVMPLCPARAAGGSSGLVPDGYRLAWHDEFDRLELGDGGWQPFWPGWGVRHLEGNQDKAVKYADDETLPGGGTPRELIRADGRWTGGPMSLHEVSNGTLKLRAFPIAEKDRVATGGFPFLAAMISGEQSHAQLYGYWETRLRLPRLGIGQHFAVWLLPTTGGWPPEIDILEVVGQHPAKFSANSIYKDKTGIPPMTFYQAPAGADGWHIFGFEWTQAQMRWSVNGRTVREHASRPTDTPFYMLISWEIGSKWPGSPDASTPWPAEAEVDYVRIYQR